MKKILTFVIILLCSLQARPLYALSTAISNGTAWLSANQNADGSWGMQSDLTLVYSSEVINALKYLDPNGVDYNEGINWLSLQDATSADELSRKIFSLTNAGQDASALISTLVNNRYFNGGWGLKAGDSSNPLDTALALQALKAANYSDTTVLYQAINYLTMNQNPDGGWGFYNGNASNVYVTALTLRALAAYDSIFKIQDSIQKASASLLTNQNTDGGFGSSPSTIYETALSPCR